MNPDSPDFQIPVNFFYVPFKLKCMPMNPIGTFFAIHIPKTHPLKSLIQSVLFVPLFFVCSFDIQLILM